MEGSEGMSNREEAVMRIKRHFKWEINGPEEDKYKKEDINSEMMQSRQQAQSQKLAGGK